MLKPSYVDIMNVVNKDVAENDERVIDSRYSVVLAASKRARQLIDGSPVLVDVPEKTKPLSAAIKELEEAKVKILG